MTSYGFCIGAGSTFLSLGMACQCYDWKMMGMSGLFCVLAFSFATLTAILVRED